MSAIPGLLLKWLFKKPLYITIRSGNPSLVSKNFIMRYIVRQADFLLATADEYFQHLHLSGADSSKFIKIRNGVNPNFNLKSKETLRKELDLDLDRIIIISTAYLIPRKNPKLLLNAFHTLSKKYNNISLVFVGDGPLEKELRAYVSNNNFNAYKLIESWPKWPSRLINIFGPSGCGKTHLVNILKSKIHSVIISSDNVSDEILSTYKTKECLIIDNYNNDISEKK